MELRSLRYFVAVYEEHSLSAASKRCFVAQPSISAAIQQLENKLDCQLFVRHSKGVTPTPQGTQLYTQACRVLDDIQSIQQQLHVVFVWVLSHLLHFVVSDSVLISCVLYSLQDFRFSFEQVVVPSCGGQYIENNSHTVPTETNVTDTRY